MLYLCKRKIMINELRIGNLVLTKDGITKVSDVLEVGINMIHDSWEYDIEDIKPIPLTEEWLVKFGCVVYYGFYSLDNIYFELTNEGVYLVDPDNVRDSILNFLTTFIISSLL